MAGETQSSESYDPARIEPKWQRLWEREGLHKVDLDGAPRPFYNLMEFPYPSSEGLHVGHCYTYGGADTYGRYRRMRGDDVFQPMGFDAFGIHSENYALKVGQNPAVLVPRNVRRFREEQLKRIGAAFDWSHQVDTSDPPYYRWTQWIFLQLYKGGLAYRDTRPVNWCPSCLTTLAHEQVIEGRCERCHTPVTQRELTQWFFRITDYAERLLDFSGADFPAMTISLQRNWIGRKKGAEIDFRLAASDQKITVFTTRADTLYGATFLVLAPEHPLATQITTAARQVDVEAYRKRTAQRSEVERLSAGGEKTGVYTGAQVVNPVHGRQLPVWVADYVLMDFGTGAIFGTPAHDQRDLDFARAHGLPVRVVVLPSAAEPVEAESTGAEPVEAYEGEGILIHSGRYDGLSTTEARAMIVADLAAQGQARQTVSYRLHDWTISRQRYWGPPIPMIYCPVCGEVPVPEADLPVKLPVTDNFRPLGTGLSPLASIPEFVNTRCPHCGGPARRETDVSDNFLDSAWYFIRYLYAHRDDVPWAPERLEHWLPVSLYFGGPEHSTMHHLYARFLWKALQDLGQLPRDLGPEPFARLRLHGTIISEGAKMSKSRG
ncbi:MAG: leucine--tRNA ligase, partial [Anaerolineae bacterium]|nr:leucine--tRNA ligase [Anaerolineae bacterium]